jgi:hypothetical protein
MPHMTNCLAMLLQKSETSRPGACTMRFLRHIEHPTTTSGSHRSAVLPSVRACYPHKQTLRLKLATGLAHLESVDEEAIVYIRAASETAEAQLTLTVLAHSLSAIEASIKQVRP